MAYKGITATLPLGTGGLHTDDNQDKIPPYDLIKAENISLRFGYVEKDYGSRRWSKSSLGSPVVSLLDFWTDQSTQRVLAATADGKVYKYTTPYIVNELTAESGSQAQLKNTAQTCIIPCGMEDLGKPRKAFIFTGDDPVQVVSGDGITRRDITKPAADWSTTNQPSFGIVHRGRVYAFGNRNNPHQVYASNSGDHENFQSSILLFNVYPGEGERIVSAHIYRGRLFVFKYPLGVYYLVDTDNDPTNWYFTKLTDAFGICSPKSAIAVLDDFLAANNAGGVTSFKITQKFGGIQSGDIFNFMKVKKYVQENLRLSGFLERAALFYEYKNLAYFTYRSNGGTKTDRIVVLDFTNPEIPKVTINTRDQATCIALKKDLLQTHRPIYGSDDGYIYEMGTEGIFTNHNINGSGYVGSFQTPHLDFGFLDPAISERNKIFDHLEISFLPVGNSNVNIDVFIDNDFIETLQFKQSAGNELGQPISLTGTMRLGDYSNRSYRKPLHGMGRRISFLVYNGNADESFKISSLKVYFRLAAQQQKGN